MLAAAYSHGYKYLMKDLGDMSKSFIKALCNSDSDSVSIPVSNLFLILFQASYLLWNCDSPCGSLHSRVQILDEGLGRHVQVIHQGSL